MAQIRWLSELALFNLDIKYQIDKTTRAADALSHYSQSEDEESNEASSSEYDTVSYATACEIVRGVINGEK